METQPIATQAITLPDNMVGAVVDSQSSHTATIPQNGNDSDHDEMVSKLRWTTKGQLIFLKSLIDNYEKDVVNNRSNGHHLQFWVHSKMTGLHTGLRSILSSQNINNPLIVSTPTMRLRSPLISAHQYGKNTLKPNMDLLF